VSKPNQNDAAIPVIIKYILPIWDNAMPQAIENIPTSLLIIDVQRALFERGKPIYEATRLLENLNLAAAKARQAGALIIFVQHENESFLKKDTPGWQMHPDLDILKSERIVQKHHPSAFQGTDLADILVERKVDRLVIGGLVSHGCVRATVLDALSRDYSVVLLQDGHSNFHQKAAALISEWNTKLQLAGASVSPTAEVNYR
jgi:nicotinamidase-related amidase